MRETSQMGVFQQPAVLKRLRMRRILHIDMDAFFALIEQKRHPEVRREAFGCLNRLELEKKVRPIGLRMSHLEKEGPPNPQNTVLSQIK